MVEKFNYPISFEVGGRRAMFRNPATGCTFVTYDCPTYSSMVGLAHSVARINSAAIMIDEVRICSPIEHMKYKVNSYVPNRKSDLVKDKNAYQIEAVILVDVLYQVFGHVVQFAPYQDTSGKKLNSAHQLQEMFIRRLSKGQWFRPPCLGWSEFRPDAYFGEVREKTKPCEDLNFTIQNMLYTVFPNEPSDKPTPVWKDITIEKGVARYV